MNLRQYITAKKRRQAIEKEMNVSLQHIGSFTFDESTVSSRNCENMIGAAQIPLGVAGPLRIRNSKPKARSSYYIPLATTEGALVASVNRGCKAISESGGCFIEAYREGVTRGPVFRVETIQEAKRLEQFFDAHFLKLQHLAAKTSKHLALLRYEMSGAGKYRYVRLYFDTQDAMGLNMITIATDVIAEHIEKQIGIRCISVSGNYCVDKKPAFQNYIRGRGFQVRAEVELSARDIADVLKTTADALYERWLAKCMLGSALSGSFGFNAQYANVVSAMFIALGQDPAHVVEGSMGVTTTERINPQKSDTDAGLYISVYLPSVLVGTVGGGTGLATQKEALEILGVFGGIRTGKKGEHAETLAGIVGAAVLAGEISLLASLAEGSLVRAHKRLGRGESKHEV